METMNLKQKLSNIQKKLKAPKNQYNKFGKYNYRNCEDILEAVKPLCNEYRCTLIVHDEIAVYSDRIYVKAIARLEDWDSEMIIEASALAREEESKKGMDSAQVTGATSSYARKYALNGLFNIDDTKDPDTDEFKEQQGQKKEAAKDKTQNSFKQAEYESQVMTEHAKLKATMDSYGIDFREKLNDYVLQKTGLKTQDITQLTVNEINMLNGFYKSLIQAYKNQKG